MTLTYELDQKKCLKEKEDQAENGINIFLNTPEAD